MDTIIEQNIFITKHGALTGKFAAQIISKNVAKFDVA